MSLRNILFFVVLAALTGCADTKAIKRPAETSFLDGQKLFAKGKYEEAITEWKKVKESLSSPLLGTAAELRIADAQFADKNYIEAAAAYEDFRKLHPSSEKASYALYKLGLCHYNQIKTIDTDQTSVKSALTTFDTYLKEYPNAENANEVREKIAQCKIKQSRYEIYVGRFYLRTDKYASAITRLNSALEKFPTSPANDEALLYLGQAYLHSGEKAKGREALERMVKEYKSGKFVEQAKKLLAKKA